MGFVRCPLCLLEYFRSFRDGQSRPKCTLVSNALRVHRVGVNAAIQAEKRLQNNPNKVVLFWSRNKECR